MTTGKNHLLASVPIYVVLVRYLSDPTVLLSPFLSIFVLITMAGALFPDIDLLVGIRFHRSPITHSCILPLTIQAVIMFYYPNPLLILASQAFLIGVGSHLLADMSKKRIKIIPHQLEYAWYIVNGIIVFALLAWTGFFTI